MVAGSGTAGACPSTGPTARRRSGSRRPPSRTATTAGRRWGASATRWSGSASRPPKATRARCSPPRSDSGCVTSRPGSSARSTPRRSPWRPRSGACSRRRRTPGPVPRQRRRLAQHRDRQQGRVRRPDPDVQQRHGHRRHRGRLGRTDPHVPREHADDPGHQLDGLAREHRPPQVVPAVGDPERDALLVARGGPQGPGDRRPLVLRLAPPAPPRHHLRHLRHTVVPGVLRHLDRARRPTARRRHRGSGPHDGLRRRAHGVLLVERRLGRGRRRRARRRPATTPGATAPGIPATAGRSRRSRRRSAPSSGAGYTLESLTVLPATVAATGAAGS